MALLALGGDGAEGDLLGLQVGVGWSEAGGKERHRVEGAEKRGGGQSEGTRGCGDPSNVPGGGRLQQAGSCVPLIKHKGINKLFVRAH